MPTPTFAIRITAHNETGAKLTTSIHRNTVVTPPKGANTQAARALRDKIAALYKDFPRFDPAHMPSFLKARIDEAAELLMTFALQIKNLGYTEGFKIEVVKSKTARTAKKASDSLEYKIGRCALEKLRAETRPIATPSPVRGTVTITKEELEEGKGAACVCGVVITIAALFFAIHVTS